MSRDFNGTTDYLRASGAAVGTYPFTMACWFNSDSTTASQCLMGVFESSSDNNRHYLEAAGNVAGDPVRALTKTTSSVAGATSSGYSSGAWYHACGVWSASNSRTAYIGGGSSGTNTSSATPTGMDRTSLGVIDSSTQLNFANARIAFAGMWNVALTTDEITALSKGAEPLLIRPFALVAYWPIGMGAVELDRMGGYTMTIGGTPAVAANHRLVMSRRRRINHVAATGGFSAYWARPVSNVIGAH